jgi:LPS-assembly lipoprotein
VSLLNKKLTKALTLFSLLVLVSACGFQLRGTNNAIQNIYSTMRVEDFSGDNAFQQIIEQTLKDSGVAIRPESENVLEILTSVPDRRTASYSSRGKSAEFELLKDISFQFKREQSVLIQPTLYKARRTYLYRETAAVGKAEEENLLKREMDQDLAQRIIIALQRTVKDPGQ